MPVETTYFLYAIASVNRNYIYVGISEDVISRFHQHNKGLERTTRPYRPYILIYTEEFTNRIDARKREVYFKNASGKRRLKEIRKDVLQVISVSKPFG